MAFKHLFLPGFRIFVRPSIPQETELLQRNAGNLLKDCIWNNLIKVFQRGFRCPVSHEEGRDRPGKSPQVIPYGALDGFLLLLPSGCLYGLDNLPAGAAHDLIH